MGNGMFNTTTTDLLKIKSPRHWCYDVIRAFSNVEVTETAFENAFCWQEIVYRDSNFTKASSNAPSWQLIGIASNNVLVPTWFILAMEYGIHHNIPLNMKFCHACDMVQDEIYFITHFKFTREMRYIIF